MISFEEFKKIDLRVAQIISIREHPNADKLYIADIDIGGQVKQIIAGIRANYSKDELIGRKIVVVNNLEPATIRGEESHGMLLAAKNGDVPIILVPEKDAPVGSPIQ